MIIEHKVEKAREGDYYTVPLPVPKNVRKMTVAYAYCEHPSGGGLNAIDFGLENERGELVGWSGNDRREVYVGEEESSYGFLSGIVSEGEWKIIVGAYHVCEGGVAVRYTVDFELEEDRWYFGDLHSHTTASDGVFTAEELCARAKKQGLDFLALTNHNNYSENLHLPVVHGITLIPAVEWTHYMGHVNFFGIKKPFDKSFMANSEEEAEGIMAFAKRSGALVSVNHPKCRFCPYHWTLEGKFDYMEIWNGPMRKAEVDAIAFWESELSRGRRVVALGGSDFHRPGAVRLATPMTAIKAKSRSEADLLSAIKRGRVYVTNGKGGARLEMNCEGETIGGSVRRKEGLKVVVSASNMKCGETLFVKSEKGVIASFSAKSRKAGGEVDVSKEKYVYLVVIGRALLIKGAAPVAVSNPIYIEE